jgi:hypothetical protein
VKRQSVFEFALPHYEGFPTKRLQTLQGGFVSRFIRFHFSSPEVSVCFRQPRFTAIMAVPKTSVDKYYLLAGTENYVRFAREVLPV